MKKKIISILILITIIGVFVVNHLITYANTDEIKDPLYVNLAKTVTRVDEQGNTKHIGYSISEPGNDVGGQAPYIWNIIPHNKNANGTYEISTEQRNLYCVKATYGQTWFDEEEEDYVLEYNLYYDLQEDRDVVLNGLSKVTTNDDVVEKLLTPGEGKYEQLLWLLDNSYIEGQDIDKYFENVGIVSELNNGQIIYYDKDTNDELGTEPLTPTDIIAIQKMAIWYFTDGQEIKENNAENIYNKLGKYSWLFMTEDGQSYELLNDSRNKMAMYLYNYLIRNAENNKSQYNALNNYNINIPPVSVNTTGLETKGEGENTKYVLKTTRVGANYLVGPIKIEEKGKLNYNIQLEVDGLEKGRDYKYTDINGNELTSIENQNDLVGIDGGFYICLSREINSIDISIKISYIETDKTIWLKGDENGTGADKTIELHNEQPLVEIVPKTNDITVNLTSEPDEFDLALRKYVTAVHDKDGNQKTITNPRNLNDISLDTLLTGTTATYKHRKDPVVVEENDIVTYTIRIYNEGNREGYATKIVDQLPAGLIRANDVSEVVSKDKNGNNKNTYTLENSTTLATTNQIVLTIKNTAENPAQSLQPYEIGTLDYETIEIKCKVIKEAHTTEQIILTNVAWIAEAFDSESGETIPTESGLIDRDSQPQTSPDVNKDNMENYTGNDSNKNELNDDTYHYEGKQDDDDFEKLVIMPVEKVFDLALFKHIAAISKDQTIEPGEYVTDTGNIDGTYLRAPVVTAINPETGKITYEQDDKEA